MFIISKKLSQGRHFPSWMIRRRAHEHGPFIIITGAFFLRYFHINGMVLYPFVLFADHVPSEELENHEFIHVQQIKRDGFIRFYYRYLKEYSMFRLKGCSHHRAYMLIGYEQEAYQHQKNLAYRVDKKSIT